MNEKKLALLGRLALLTATLIWGSSFVVLKNTLDLLPPFWVLSCRFLLAGVLMALLGWRQLQQLDRVYWRGGACMGVFMAAAYGFQTYGLVYTTPGVNAFLTSVYSILVPFLGWAIWKKRPDGCNIAAAVIALAGVGLVSCNGSLHMGRGEGLTLICGLFYALHILATDRYIRGRSVLLLTMIQCLTAGVICLVCAMVTETPPTVIPGAVVGSVVYLFLGCTVICYLCQNFGQKHTPPAASALILTLEAVFGVLFSAIFYREAMTPRLVLGFMLIFLAVVVSETKLEFLRGRRGKMSEKTVDC